MSIAAAHSGGGTDIVTLLVSYWWLILLFGGAFLEWIGEIFDVGLGAIHRRSKLRHKRRLELRKVELQIAQANAQASGAVVPIKGKKPGPCVHRNVVSVIAADESLSAWLCKSCDAQLPVDWAVREEDL